MQAVYGADNLIDAYLVRHALEAAGIPVRIRGEALVGGVEEIPAYGLVAVCVPQSAFPQARGLIARLPLLAGDAGSADAAQPGGICADISANTSADTSPTAALPGCSQASRPQVG